MTTFTKKDAAKLRRLHRKVLARQASRSETLQALDLQRKKKAAAQQIGRKGVEQ